jgi:hypothetical protein
MSWKLSEAVPRPVFACLIVALVVTLAPALGAAAEITIQVAPATLNLASGGTVVTVHTDIAYRDVAATSVFLNDVAIDWWKVDNRGNFVAKFEMDDVKRLEGLVIGDLNTLTLVGLTVNDEPFWGSAEVMVIDRGE